MDRVPSLSQVVRGLMRWLIHQNEKRMEGKGAQARMKSIKTAKARIQNIFELVQIKDWETPMHEAL